MNKSFLKILPIIAILSMIMSSCSTPRMVPVTGATPVPGTNGMGALSDDVWERITINNKIVVGTAWDYPPFAYVDANFQVAGYDIALIQEIGARLNIPVEIQNFTFDGLQNALQIDQIDLAVAAISVTPERAGQMAFSPVYYVNQTAIMTRADSAVPAITSEDQLAGYRVGVQRGTTYQAWLQRALVDSGKMPADRLFSYMKAEEAVRDLEENRVDVVVIGKATAYFYQSQKGMKIVGTGTDQQNLAVAMRLGAPHLKAEIDRVMGDMLNDGTILRLIQAYIQTDVSGVLPTPVPPTQPTPTALPLIPVTAPAACVDGMKFVTDVTYDDNDMKNLPLLAAGEGFVKVWRLQNSGTCTWTPDYHLVYAYGNVDSAQMNGQQVSIPGNFAPGDMADVGVSLVAPNTPYDYQGFWQMENSQGQRFGQTVWVGITTTQAGPDATTLQPNGPYCMVSTTGPRGFLNARENFDAVWTVMNTSGKDWDMAETDYQYVSGTQMREKNVYDFQHTIKNGESGVLVVDMLAPDQAGSYNSKWVIVSANALLCYLYVTVTVQ